jgi:hypothetical protein
MNHRTPVYFTDVLSVSGISIYNLVYGELGKNQKHPSVGHSGVHGEKLLSAKP